MDIIGAESEKLESVDYTFLEFLKEHFPEIMEEYEKFKLEV